MQTKNHSCTSGIKSELAARFGFRLSHNYNHERTAEKFIIERFSFTEEFETQEQAICWLKGYEFHAVLASEYKS